MASSLVDLCRFTATLGGTTDWVYSTTVTGYQSPALAGAVNTAIYACHSQSADLLQWEVSTGAYTSGTGTFARTTILYNSLGSGTLQGGGGTKINFTLAPQVAVVALTSNITPLPNPSASTLGGVQSAAAVSHQWINSISTTGVPALSQPAVTDISGGAALTAANDTNVTLTLSGTPTTALLIATLVTAGWTGTLAAARLNANVVQGVTNDTNVTGSIAAQVLTLGWTGTLATSRMATVVPQGVNLFNHQALGGV